MMMKKAIELATITNLIRLLIVYSSCLYISWREAPRLPKYISLPVRYPPHQYFSMLSTRKLEIKTQRVKQISRVEFSLLTRLFWLSDKMYDYWYKAWVSVIRGALW